MYQKVKYILFSNTLNLRSSLLLIVFKLKEQSFFFKLITRCVKLNFAFLKILKPSIPSFST